MKLRHLLVLLLLLSMAACAPSKKAALPQKVVNLDTLVIPSAPEPVLYRASRTRKNDLLHTKLEVRFDWNKTYLYGKATLTLKPWFYPTSMLELDAKGFDLHEVALLLPEGVKKVLSYSYKNDTLVITLDREYKKDETYTVFIDYTAKPNERKSEGSEAIAETKGLYFINPDGKDPDKPRQLWTQGETESNSCWFPTIDSPNERMTQEIYITVEQNFVTLSNGLLVYSNMNPDGTRTDYWKQSLPAAPYLTMMAAGEFAVVKDKWRTIEVSYYVEKEFEKYARMVFGKTPEMIEFFSKKLGIDFPWEKYSQIVVRDYVSGAMENTTAVTFQESFQMDDREYLDDSQESTVAHELFHHWFGDLVTSESWSNLPLNESFANYSQYLWDEYKYGKNEADYGQQSEMRGYLSEARGKQVNLIRYVYDDKEDMFDAHSYNKGGRVLHMLRAYVGDDAFFASLKLYLETNKFSSAEIHDLRLAFEKVTGEDLQWFFNQWFLSPGHPVLDIKYSYNDSLKQQTIFIKQKQDFEKVPLFTIPMYVDIYVNGRTERNKVTLRKATETLVFPVSAKPDLVNVDAEKKLLCSKKDVKTPQEFSYQYYHAPLYLDRYEAIAGLSEAKGTDSLTGKTIYSALSDSFWNIRITAISNVEKAFNLDKMGIKTKLMDLAVNDPKSAVRASAIRALAKYYDDKELISLYKQATSDRSYAVVSTGLEALGERNLDEALAIAKTMEQEKNSSLLNGISELYAGKGKDEQDAFFQTTFPKMKGANRYTFVQNYGRFLTRCNDETISKGVRLIEDVARHGDMWWVRYAAAKAILDIQNMYEDKERTLSGREEKAKKEKVSPEELQKISDESAKVKTQKEAFIALLSSIKNAETDKTLKKIYSNF